mmetsp:Transcript_5749/g.12762  ORF Transcript_5749/g.12762 Transcript_5749/m.12762 type:complete len:168 (+) Transcript_5749:203-706(+)
MIRRTPPSAQGNNNSDDQESSSSIPLIISIPIMENAKSFAASPMQQQPSTKQQQADDQRQEETTERRIAHRSSSLPSPNLSRFAPTQDWIREEDPNATPKLQQHTPKRPRNNSLPSTAPTSTSMTDTTEATPMSLPDLASLLMPPKLVQDPRETMRRSHARRHNTIA